MNFRFRNHIIISSWVATFLLLLSSSPTLARIQFRNINIESAINIAKEENKLVFVDTYASWCAPCKILDRVFDEPEVSNYFNHHFINVKIDMEGPQGDKMLYDYEVVWLPTMLIIDGNGNIRTKIDELISGKDLLSLAKSAVAGMHINATSSLSSTPFAGTSQTADTQDYDPTEKEQVIYVYDEKASSGRPHIMYHEAYLHLQLMDGQHQKVVKKYLSTQSDWSSEKNIRFIFDFLQNVRSEEFEYFISHRQRFEEVIGPDRVIETLGILVNQLLTKGYPRPTLDEARKLYEYIDPVRAQSLAYDYFLNRLLIENKYERYMSESREYLENVNPFDIPVICKYSELELASGRTTEFNVVLNYLTQASYIEDNNPEIHFLLSNVYFLQKDKTNATKHIANAILHVSASSEQLEKYVNMQLKIESML